MKQIWNFKKNIFKISILKNGIIQDIINIMII